MGLDFRVYGSGVRVYSLGLTVWAGEVLGLGYLVLDSGFGSGV